MQSSLPQATEINSSEALKHCILSITENNLAKAADTYAEQDEDKAEPTAVRSLASSELCEDELSSHTAVVCPQPLCRTTTQVPN